jgi:hypothetical protein
MKSTSFEDFTRREHVSASPDEAVKQQTEAGRLVEHHGTLTLAYRTPAPHPSACPSGRSGRSTPLGGCGSARRGASDDSGVCARNSAPARTLCPRPRLALVDHAQAEGDLSWLGYVHRHDRIAADQPAVVDLDPLPRVRRVSPREAVYFVLLGPVLNRFREVKLGRIVNVRVATGSNDTPVAQPQVIVYGGTPWRLPCGGAASRGELPVSHFCSERARSARIVTRMGTSLSWW